MRSLGTRRVAQAAGAALAVVVALGGCSAGQVAETAILKAPISGLDTQSPDGSLLIRNLQVIYNGPAGYPAGGTAPLQLSLFNQTRQPITVLISSRPPSTDRPGIVSARQVALGGGAAAASPSANPEPSPGPASANSGFDEDQIPEPTGSVSPDPSVPPVQGALRPARITIPGLSSAVYLPGDAESVQLVGLSDRLVPGNSVSLTFEVSTSQQPIEALAPMAIPTSPASRGPAAEVEEGH